MMAAYWRSPYKESTYVGGHGLATSTGRFEQSLSLTRAKSSILRSSKDLMGWHLPSPRRPGSSQQYSSNVASSFNGHLKGILKTPKATISSRINQNESNTEQVSPPQRPKRVSFGPCEDPCDDESEYSTSDARGFRAHYVTLQRINHSRRVEQSAMRKLNKLISGPPQKNQQTPRVLKSSQANPSLLSVVDGKGLLNPRSAEPVKTSCSCRHSSELECSGCASKDAETGEIETKAPPTEPEKAEDPGDPKLVFGIHAEPDSINEPSTLQELDPSTEPTKVALPVTLFDDFNNEQSVEKASGRRRATPRKTKPAGFHSKKFQSKLLPGRYPFNTGAIHLRNANLKRKDIDKTTRLEDKIDITALSIDQTAGSRLSNSSRTAPKTGATQISPDSARSQSTETSDGNYGSVSVVKQRGDSRDKERRYTDKTSQILTWLKDVRQKSDYKPRSSRFLVIESQASQ